mgnify:CR=1 FL=1
MKQLKRGLAFLLVLVMVMGSMGTGVVAAPTAKIGKKAAVKTVAITKPDTKTLVMKKGQSFTLKTKVTTSGKKVSKAVSYKSSNEKIVKVTRKGKLKALKNGKATITVTSKVDKKKKATIKVVVKTPVTKVKLDRKEISLTEGETAVVTATVSPKKATVKKVSYKSSNKAVAKVNSKGKITAVAEGTAVITVTSKDGNAKKATCKVTVKKAGQTSGETPSAAPTAAPSQAPTAAPSDKPSETPKPQPSEEPKPSEDPDPYDPNQKLNLQLDNSDSDSEAYAKPSIPTVSDNEYTLMWSDNFEGTELNRNDWNVETHDAGWVNAESQAYVDDEKNIYVEDGNLILRPIRQKNADGTETITSGRVNTQGKHDFTYGLFEVRAKVPTGKGFLPAFWMMPTDENLYGQWPRCGEIDAMEVMGQENNKLYGTIHYGNPHSEKQGTYTLENGNFTDEYHTFACDWEPGKITWYVDGVKYHEADDWYSTTEGQGTVAYPAPFDQPFYAILNLAVGGSWVGYPDENTKINSSAYIIDYVKIFQKDSYDEDVQAPEKEPAVFKEPDADGNYITNGDFAKDEALDGTENWQFLTTLGGDAAAVIKNGEMVITTKDQGTVDYSVQLVQPKLPAKQGYTYEVTFDAYASADRAVGIAVKAPDRSYKAYLEDSVNVTTKKQTYTLTYKMDDADDANSRLEFNMGAKNSTATLYLSNVKVKVKKAPTQEELDQYAAKKVLTDGNCIYNGKFQEGTDRLAYWEVKKADGAQVSVTKLADGRRLKVVGTEGGQPEDVTISQNALPIAEGTDYILSFEAQADKAATIQYTIGGMTKSVDVTAEKVKYTQKFSKEEVSSFADKDFAFLLGNAGEIYIDNVRFEEDALIMNGKFNAGTSGFEVYVDGSASASYVVDSQSEDNALDLDIKNTGDAEWKIQVKQGSVTLEEDQWYTLSFDIRSSMARSIQYAIQRDGSVHKDVNGKEDWTPYVQETVKLDASAKDYTTVTKTFQMMQGTDTGSIFNIALGGGSNTTQHRVCIDNISLVKTEAPKEEEEPEGTNLLKNGDFSDGEEGWSGEVISPAEGKWDFTEKNATVTTTNAGTAAWNVNLKQKNVTLKKGAVYEVKATITSDVDRTAEFACMDSSSSNWYVQGDNHITLKANEPTNVTFKVGVGDGKTDNGAYIGFNLGKISEDTPDTSVIMIDDVSMIKISGEDSGDTEEPEEPEEPSVSGNNILRDSEFENGNWKDWGLYSTDDKEVKIENGSAVADLKSVGTDPWSAQLKQENIAFEAGAKYILKMTVNAEVSRIINVQFNTSANGYIAGTDIELTKGENVIKQEITVEADKKTVEDGIFKINLGKIDQDTPAGKLVFYNVTLVKVNKEN